MNILIIPDEETENLNGSLKIRRVSSVTPQVLTSYGADKEITYRGGHAPFIQFTMFAPTRSAAGDPGMGRC
jgi:hypothetical protein